MTNPNDSVGTNGAFGGRTSVNAFNDALAVYDGRGILSGWDCQPDTGMTVTLGGDGVYRDVAIAEDNVGNKTTINNITESPISITISGAPVTGNRIDAIVAYVDKPPQGSSSAVDNPGACGLIVVESAVASSPVAPTESDIRSAITADGASGTTAYFVTLATISVRQGMTDITTSEITVGNSVTFKEGIIGESTIADGSITSAKLANSAVSSTKIASSAVSSAKLANSAVTETKIASSAVSSSKIASGAVTTAKLNDGAVTDEKVDWSSIASRSGNSTATISGSTSWTNTGASITIPKSGTYLFLGVATVNGTSGGVKHLMLRMATSSGTQIGNIADSYGGDSGNSAGALSLNTIGIASVSAETIVRLQFRATSSGVQVMTENNNYPTIIAVRVGELS